MKELLYKEFKLVKHPSMYIFPFFAAMLLIPSYPYALAFVYVILAVFYVFLSARENNDIVFTSLLPIRKRDIVKSRFLLVIIMELIQVIMCIPFAVINNKIYLNINVNQAGIEANIALFAFALIMLALFNIIFLPMFYKTGYKVGIPFVVAAVIVSLAIGIMETLVNIIPYLKKILDTNDKFIQLEQLPLLFIGIIIYVLLTFLSYKLSVNRFSKVDIK